MGDVEDLLDRQRKALEEELVKRFLDESRGVLTSSQRAGLVRAIFNYSMTPDAVRQRDSRSDKPGGLD